MRRKTHRMQDHPEEVRRKPLHRGPTKILAKLVAQAPTQTRGSDDRQPTKIVTVGSAMEAAPCTEEIDASGQTLLAGLIDAEKMPIPFRAA